MTVLMAATASGSLAHDLAAAGVDGLVAYHSSVYRARGLPSVAGLLPWASANQQVLDALPQVVAGAGETPVVATVCANDGLIGPDAMLDAIEAGGAHGVLNAPTVGLLSGVVRDVLEAEGLGMSAEFSLLRAARERGLESWAYVFDAGWTRAALEAGATGLVLHLGITGHPTDPSVSPAATCLAMLDAIPAYDDTPVLLHGGPLRRPGDVGHLLAELPLRARMRVNGFFGASAFETPTGHALPQAVAAWRAALEGTNGTEGRRP